MMRNQSTPKRVTNDSQGQLLRRQLSEHAANTRAGIAANIINMVIVAVAFSTSISPNAIIACFCFLLVVLVWRHRICRLINDGLDDVRKLQSLEGDLRLNATMLGGFWGFVCGGLLSVASPSDQMFVGILGSGMMSAGTISFRTLPQASRLYFSVCGFGCFVGLLSIGTPMAYAACGLLVCYIFVLHTHVKIMFDNFTVRNMREFEADESAETIRLLLNDYEEQGSDWLIELDFNGDIQTPCNRFAEGARRPVETLAGKSFFDLLDDGTDKDRVTDHFNSRRAFRQQIVSITIEGEQRWWSINARPADGGFRRYRGVVTDITAQRQAEEKVSYMAHYDGLTDLPNRFQFNESLYRAFNRNREAIGLMYLDLDNFKTVNDTLGHPVGDQLLKAVARRLEACVGEHDMIARLGGDEFAIMVAPENLDQIDAMASRIISAMGKPFSLDGHDVVIGSSIGIACAPDHGDSGEKLLQNADLALYAAKTGGRNRAARFEAGMDEVAQSRRLLELDLRSALGKDEMRLHYQPLVNVETGVTNGYEALIRWEHPERGTVMPNLFIPIAEETGLIIQIGEWVIRQAMDDLATWEEEVTVSINLSPAQMRSPSLISTLVNALASTGVDSARVCLEITETVLMQDSEANMETLHRLRGLGVQIALDDFGTGYSSLNYLRSFPFDKIKIDRCFVAEIDSREDCRAIVRSVVNLAHSLGMTTTAEGVERAEQVEHLRAEGCGEVQGFLYSKAVPAGELTDLRQPQHAHAAQLVAMEEARVRKLANAPAKESDEAKVPRRRSA
jgi:diguanylate cyclase (GGDEF)-like protein